MLCGFCRSCLVGIVLVNLKQLRGICHEESTWAQVLRRLQEVFLQLATDVAILEEFLIVI